MPAAPVQPQESIMTFDPGGTTGWALWDPMRKYLDEPYIKSGQIGPEQHHYELNILLDQYEPNRVIYERFDNRANAAAELISLEYIGVIKLWAQCNQPRITLLDQGVSDMKAWIEAKNGYAKLKATGLWIPGKPHENDARGHLLFHLFHRGYSTLQHYRPDIVQSLFNHIRD